MVKNFSDLTNVNLVNNNKYLFRLRKDVSFLNKAVIKQKLEQVPSDSYVIIDAARADFIDRDVVETIEDFMIHAPLKNIVVELKKSNYKEQGFVKKITAPASHGSQLVRTTENEVKEIAVTV